MFLRAKRMNQKQLLILLTSISLTSCSTQTLQNKIESSSTDVLAEESFMRFDSKRIDLADATTRDNIAKALLACHAKKFFKGMSLSENEMQQNKNNPFYWNALGSCYYLSENFTKALFFYNVGIEAAQTTNFFDNSLALASIYNNIGLIHLEYKRFNEAFDMFIKSSTISPSLITPHFNLAQLYVEFNFDDKALLILKNLEAKNPNDIDLLYLKSVVYFRKGNYTNSLAELKKIQQDYLNRADIVGLYAYNLLIDKKLEEAKNIMDRRTYANEYNERNKLISEKINEEIKELKAKKTTSKE